MNGSMKPWQEWGGISPELELELGPEQPKLGPKTFRAPFCSSQGYVLANSGRNGTELATKKWIWY